MPEFLAITQRPSGPWRQEERKDLQGLHPRQFCDLICGGHMLSDDLRASSTVDAGAHSLGINLVSDRK
jgi:hypothetical protein